MADLYADDDLLLLSGIQHFAFCQRQWALIHIEQQWQENLSTFEGRNLHEQVDNPFFTEKRGTVLITRSLPLISYQLGLYGVADLVEFHQSSSGISINKRVGLWQPYPVEYKYGKAKKDDCDLVQLCAQAICLEEMLGVRIIEGDLFYGRTRSRLHVEFDRTLRQRVIDLTTQMHELFEHGRTPPSNYTKACKNCSLIEICLPQLGSKDSVARYLMDISKD